MPTNTNALFKKLIGHFRYLEKTRKKAESLFHEKIIVRRDIEIIYVGLFLDIVTSFEGFIEDLFLNLLVDDTIHPLKSVKAKFSFNNIANSRTVICGGRNYIDWFPYNFTIKRAKIYFKSGRPFTNFDKVEKKYLEEILYIRNALAHRSNYSIRQLNRNVIKDLPLTSKEKTVTGFLRSFYVYSPSQTRYEYYVFQLAYLAKKLVQ